MVKWYKNRCGKVFMKVMRERKMKKIISLILTVTIAFSMVCVPETVFGSETQDSSAETTVQETATVKRGIPTIVPGSLPPGKPIIMYNIAVCAFGDEDSLALARKINSDIYGNFGIFDARVEDSSIWDTGIEFTTKYLYNLHREQYISVGLWTQYAYVILSSEAMGELRKHQGNEEHEQIRITKKIKKSGEAYYKVSVSPNVKQQKLKFDEGFYILTITPEANIAGKKIKCKYKPDGASEYTYTEGKYDEYGNVSFRLKDLNCYLYIIEDKPADEITEDKPQEDNKTDTPAPEKTAEEIAKEKLINGIKNTTVTITSTYVGKTSYKLKWKKSKGYKVDYYQVYQYDKLNKNKLTKLMYSKTGFVSCRGGTVKKKFEYKVRGVRVIDNKKYYTKWSDKKCITLK